ncbi:MAG: ABC transporter ATP-binding protein [Gammaproteobacteria bacterium]|nr:ABC transporter ATP-binding protein [Gammaproteobacteria bacterium]
MIEIENLTKRFGPFVAVDNLSFSVAAGQVLGFLGPNGAGKSTTMRMLAGFLRPDSGRIRIFGDDLNERPLQVKSRLGYLPEGAPSYGDMPVQGFLQFIAQARGIERRQRSARIAAIMARLQLETVANRSIETLSKGFQRRVGLAQALIHDPCVLLLDEPTDGLDPNQKHEVRQLIRQLSDDKIVIISTHILEEVEAVCQRAVIINHGRLVADATPAQLKSSSDYFQAVELELDDAEGIAPALRQLAGVREVVVSPGQGNRVRVMAAKHAVIWPAVQAFLQDRGIRPQSLSVSAGRLDDVFRRITVDQDPGREGEP